jgi:anti-anti-sigma factor
MSAVQVELTHVNAIPVLRITGEMRLDIADVERALNRLAAGRPRVVVIDLGAVPFISSLGMGLLNAFRRGLLSHGGVTRLASPQPDVLNALTLCKLTDLFQIHLTLASATSKS